MKRKKQTEPAEVPPLENALDEPEPEDVRRLHVFFSGSVQGVGFRYTALNISNAFLITGWVRNCCDGRVELVAEGEVQELENYLRELSEEMSGYISGMERVWEPATGEWKDFHVAPTE